MQQAEGVDSVVDVVDTAEVGPHRQAEERSRAHRAARGVEEPVEDLVASWRSLHDLAVAAVDRQDVAPER